MIIACARPARGPPRRDGARPRVGADNYIIYIYMHICICVYIYIYIHVCIIYIYIYMYMYIYYDGYLTIVNSNWNYH